MKGFGGFPDGKVRSVPLPEPFFAELLPLVDHLGELKVTLYAFWRLGLKDGRYRFLLREDFAGDELLLQGLSASPRLAAFASWDARCAWESICLASFRKLSPAGVSDNFWFRRSNNFVSSSFSRS